MWPLYIFLGLLASFILQWIWQDWRLKRQRARAQQEYTAALLQQQRTTNLQAQAQQHALFNSMAEGVLLLDPNEKIILINPSLRKWVKVPSHVAGDSVELLKWPELPVLLADLKSRQALAGVELQLSGVTRRAHLQLNASVVLDHAQKIQGYLFVFHDLTRQKELEKLRQDFVANVSHELRTPLSLIKGFTETLLNGAKDDASVASSFLQKIDKHADRLLFLIEDLLTISRLESGQAGLNLQEVPLDELTAKVLEDVQSQASGRKVRLQNDIPPGTKVWGDSDRLQQVLSNLVDNAVKYGPAQGVVRVGQHDNGNGKIEVFVQDDGPGIPAESQSRLFERFYRVDRARARETGGTGLGLAIVKHIVQAHGGEVWVKSAPGHGSTFTFTISKPTFFRPPSS
jgi:two-component system, OmpR family, phosphate regulon sensor histidine kinase PhoR